MNSCQKCGALLEADKPYCTNCGAPVPVEGQSPRPPEPGFPPHDHRPDMPPPRGSRFAPLSVGGFLGTLLLLCIPLVNFILMIVWACGGTRNVNRRNLARAMLIICVISAVLTVVLMLLLGGFDQMTEIISMT